MPSRPWPSTHRRNSSGREAKRTRGRPMNHPTAADSSRKMAIAAQAMSFFCLSVKTCLFIRNLDPLILELYHILPAIFEQIVK